MKFVGAFALVVGLGMLIFACLAYSELRNAASSETAPAPDSMPLTKIVGPELFDTGNTTAKPADLARLAFNRIFFIGIAALTSIVLGGVLLSFKRTPSIPSHDETS